MDESTRTPPSPNLQRRKPRLSSAYHGHSQKQSRTPALAIRVPTLCDVFVGANQGNTKSDFLRRVTGFSSCLLVGQPRDK